VSNELKRLVAISVAMLTVGAGLLILPLSKMRIPSRPGNVPPTSLYASGEGVNQWIDCPNFTSMNRYYCTVYSHDGKDKLVQGVFQEAGVSAQRRMSYDGTSIHWKHGVVLNPLHLDCILGGKPPEVADCRTGAR
jgi:hypothetical protein